MHHQTQSENRLDHFTDLSINVGTTERVASLIGGGAMLAYGISRGGVLGTALGILGGVLLFRGSTGHCHLYDAAGIDTAHGGGEAEGTRRSPYGRSLLGRPVHVTRSILIAKPAAELYGYWRELENLPRFMKHLEKVSVRDGDGKISHWRAKAPLGMSVEWDAELTSDVANERIGWKSLEGSDVVNSGVVNFREVGGDRGTLVRVDLTYEAPGGKLGEWIAWALGEEPGLQVEDDLRRFKMLMETGRIVTNEGQPSGREPMRSGSDAESSDNDQAARTRTARA
ncbi:MAG: SRPBCC family protein [Pyrinomonadaceae bacterium]